MALAAGRLRHRVTIQQPVHTQDPDTGAMTTTWADVAEVAAEVAPMSVREFIASAAMQSQVTARITIRYRPGIDASMRVVHKDRIYNIQGVLSDPESGLEYLTLPCSEGTNEGE